ncbi:zinc finger BED domain-containing protein 4-like [Sycon ciliatum]|uniref:zinc finger BED domain-containing protein 4-like n=1 Tax=Sycon ciliatum TaxID=27933 RepID=UPI0031F6436E
MSKVVFSRASRSKVWDHFEKSGDKPEASCKLCKKSFIYNGGTTSNLLAHLKSAHPSVVASNEPASKVQKSGAIDKFVLSRARATKPCSGADAEALTQLLVDWITTDMRPLNIVNDDGLKRLLRFMEPSFNVPSRTHIASVVKRKHSDGKEEVKAMMKSARRVAVTTDGWTSKAVRSYSTFTAHFLDDNWDLQSVVLATRPLDDRHTAVNIAAQLKEIVEEFGISEKVVAIVHDEARNMVAASTLLQADSDSDVQGVVCAAHMLQTCLRHALDSSKPVQKLLAEGRRLVGHFHHSSHATAQLNAQQVSHAKENKLTLQQPLRLMQDVTTGWNSMYYMLRRLLELRPHVTSVLVDTAKTPKADHRALLLKEKRWATAEQLMEVLAPSEKATRLLSGQKYLTISCVMPVVMSLHTMALADAGKAAANGEAAIAQLCHKLASELANKFHLDPVDLSRMHVSAAALDPRSRSLAFLDDAGRKAVKLELLQRCIADGQEAATAAEPAPKRTPQDLDLFFGAATVEEVSYSAGVERELEVYFSETTAPPATNPLKWWCVNEDRLPHLAKVAKAILCVPATSVPSERVFSAAGHIVSKRRAGLSEESVDALIFLQQNKSLKVHTSHAVPPEFRAPVTEEAPVALDVVLDDELPLQLPSL